jgi:hypothetical protein
VEVAGLTKLGLSLRLRLLHLACVRTPRVFVLDIGKRRECCVAASQLTLRRRGAPTSLLKSCKFRSGNNCAAAHR